MTGLVALDRDGTIIEERPYLSDPGEVVLLPGAAKGLATLVSQGFRLVLVTNQSGVGRGYFGIEAVERVNHRLSQLLAEEGVRLHGTYVCPHLPSASCGCRKPDTGMLERAASDLGASLREAFLIGDKECDVEMGQRAGATMFLVRTGWGRETERSGIVCPDFVADDLEEVASQIVGGKVEEIPA